MARTPRTSGGTRAAQGADVETVAGDAFRDPAAEWLEADGLGGFASGPASGIRTRRYHTLLMAALTPPTGRHALVNDVEAWVETDTGRHASSSQRYDGGVVDPDGASRIVAFAADPWPRWRFRLADGTELEHEIFVPHGCAAVALRWKLVSGPGAARLEVRPLLSGRRVHALMRENDAFRFDANATGGRVAWAPYTGLPAIAAYSNGEYTHQPDWYRHFLYTEERARGLDAVEDLGSPGVFRFDLAKREAVLVFAAESDRTDTALLDRLRGAAVRGGARGHAGIIAAVRALATTESHRRLELGSRLRRAGDAYLVRRGKGTTIVAGYPWFTDWGRDTFIAVRGLCLAADRLDDAGKILCEWAGAVSQGMLPNRFVEDGGAPEYYSVDASLWYVIAVHEYLDGMTRRGRRVTKPVRAALEGAVQAILEGYANGTRYGIRLDSDGLIVAGEPGLTWMDARSGDRAVTPRVGKPVEVQALWLNALRAARAFGDRWEDPLERGAASFRERFWNAEAGALHDVIDVNHVRGATDGSIRPNMLFAVGGLPYALIEGERARSIVDVAERELWTPLGPRSLSPGDPAYQRVYQGGPVERDGAYHQGTVWPWLAGAFVEAWVRVRGGTNAARKEAKARFVEPLLAQLDRAGLGHISEVADAEAPHTPRGCPFQAWSVGELLRLTEVVLAPRATTPGRSIKPDPDTWIAPATRV